MSTPPSSSPSQVRIKRPERLQVTWRPLALDQCLPADHQARLIWKYVDGLDLSAFHAKIKAVPGGVGRDAVDPRILMALWLFATVEGISSARRVARLCERDLAYQWICGGVGVNHHLLSDFRSGHEEVLDQLFTNTIATLLHQGLVTLTTVAQDGMRVRASAGSSSFRRRATLEERQREARAHVERLNQERANEAVADASEKRREAAQLRAAEEREARLKQALAELDQLQSQHEQQPKNKQKPGKEPRVSTTDPEARRMKMADGGFRPGYNIQLATTGDTRLIVGVDVTNCGSDSGQMGRMHAQLQERYQQTPENCLVDSGFNSKADLTLVEQRGTAVYAPIHSAAKMLASGNDPYAPQPGDSPEMIRYRARMKTEAAQTLYKQRSSIAEYPNAEFRNRGLGQLRVRGLAKVRTTALWHALSFNFKRLVQLKFLCFAT
jgi:transposase